MLRLRRNSYLNALQLSLGVSPRRQSNTLWSRCNAPMLHPTADAMKGRLCAGPVVAGPRAPSRTDRDPVGRRRLLSVRRELAHLGHPPDARRHGHRDLDQVIRLAAARLFRVLAMAAARHEPIAPAHVRHGHAAGPQCSDALCNLLMARGLTYVAADKAANLA